MMARDQRKERRAHAQVIAAVARLSSW